MLRRFEVGRHPDLPQVLLDRGLDRLRHLVENVAGFMKPTPLMLCPGEDLVESLPEPQRAVGDRQFRSDREPARLQVDQQLMPALGAFADADLEAEQFLLAFRRGADHHQHAVGHRLHAGLEVDAIGPDIDVAPGRQVTLLPARVIIGPALLQPGDDRGRQVGCVLAQQDTQRLLEITGRDAAQVQDRQQGIQTCRPARPARQQRRGEPDPLGCRAGSPIANLDPLELDRPNPGLDHAFRPMTMPDQPVPAVGQLQLLPGGQKGFHLGLDGLFEQPARSRAQEHGQRIVDLVRLRKPDNAAIFFHGVSLPRGGSGRLVTHLDTSPSSPRHHPVSAIAPSTGPKYITIQRFLSSTAAHRAAA